MTVKLLTLLSSLSVPKYNVPFTLRLTDEDFPPLLRRLIIAPVAKPLLPAAKLLTVIVKPEVFKSSSPELAAIETLWLLSIPLIVTLFNPALIKPEMVLI